MAHSRAQTAVIKVPASLNTDRVPPIENGTKSAKGIVETGRSDVILSHSSELKNSFHFKSSNEELQRQPSLEVSFHLWYSLFSIDHFYFGRE